MGEQALSKEQVKQIAEYIYANLNDYIAENYDIFIEFLEQHKEKEDNQKP